MFRFAQAVQQLPADQRFALSLLVDSARLVPADVPEAVELRVRSGSAPPERLAAAQQFRVVDGGGAVEVGDGSLALVARIAGAVDEQRSTNVDRHGRVPPADNYLASRKLEREPAVSRVAAELRWAVVAAAGTRRVAMVAPWPGTHRWAMAMTHDLDVVALWPVFTAMRVAELAGKRRFSDVTAVIGGAARQLGRDPVWHAARHVLDTERRFGIRSTWFVIAGARTFASVRAGDVTYSVESRSARRLIDAVRLAGHEIGLHGSFATALSPERFTSQRERLERVSGSPARGVRQHFIRMRPGATHQAMQAAGFAYDSTFGFSDRNGFRLGLADVTPVWSDALGSPLAIDTVPFVWMDRALSKYRGVEDPAEWIEDAAVTARACREVEGVWNGIWHPNLATPLGFPGAAGAFESLCNRLMSDSPWSATLDEIVRWRRARRTAHVVGVAPDGALRLGVTQPAEWPVVLEDEQRRPVRTIPA